MEQATRLYRMSDGTLEQTTDNLVDSAERDAVPLLELGVTAATILEITAARTAFSAMPGDAFLMGAMMIGTQAKNALRKELTHSTRHITGLAQFRFGEQSGEYVQFGTKELSRQTDNDLVHVCRDVLHATQTYAAQLLDDGITPIKITAYQTLITDFDNAIDTQRRAIKNRDQSVVQRIGLGNALYTLITKLAGKGKLCWIDVNEALYNDYVIYNNPQSTGQVIEGDIAGNGAVVSTSIQDASNTTVLEITNTGNVPFTCFFAALPTDTTAPQEMEIPPNSTQTFPATALGYSVQSPRFNIVNNAPSIGSYRVVWE